MQRYFVDFKNDKVILSDNDKNHIKKVMRMKNNDLIEVVFNRRVFNSKIIDINNVELELLNEVTLKNDMLINVTIAQALVREQKWDLILQKTTELGVHEIVPLKLERCNVNVDNNKETKKIDRWNMICKEASEQSYRNYIPTITGILNLKELVKKEYDLKLFCSTIESSTHLKDILQKNKKCDNILIVIGPEGGLTNTEEKLMLDNGFYSISLGNTILRTETAPIFVLSSINYESWS